MLLIKPITRSWLRVRIGKLLYTTLRYFDWYFSHKHFAVKFNSDTLPYCIFKHRTPLIRKLKNLDMLLQYNKVENLRIAAKEINRVIVRPGETLSYWKLIGRPTKRKGYKDGLVLRNGSLVTDVGGGLCQFSNLIYWMTLHTSLTVTERYRHSYDVFPDSDRKQPFGSGATCVYNYRDLQIYNGTNRTYQLIVYITDHDLAGEWRTDDAQEERYEVYEKNHCINSTFWGGYIRSNELYRRVYDNFGELIRDEYITENNALMMYQPYIEEKSREKYEES